MPQDDVLVKQEINSRMALYDTIGRLIIEKEYEIDSLWLFKQLFENNEFFIEFWGSKKFYGLLN